MSYVRETPPDRLYKYQPFSARSLAALKVRTLWFGPPSAFDDPFDCSVPFRAAEVSDDDCLRLTDGASRSDWSGLKQDRLYVDGEGRPTRELKRVLQETGERALRAKLQESYWNRGVTCFSERPDDLLLWAHYGGAHRGICLEFDTSSPLLAGKLHKVSYSDEIPVLNVVDELLGDGSFYLRLLLRKASCWSYEREWRAIHTEAGTEYCYGVDALTGVYFGAQLSTAERDLLAHVLYGSPTKMYELRRGETLFRLEIRPIDYKPYDYGEPGGRGV